jgi:hypothetical protein
LQGRAKQLLVAKATIDFAFSSKINAAQFMKCKQGWEALLRARSLPANPFQLTSERFYLIRYRSIGGDSR